MSATHITSPGRSPDDIADTRQVEAMNPVVLGFRLLEPGRILVNSGGRWPGELHVHQPRCSDKNYRLAEVGVQAGCRPKGRYGRPTNGCPSILRGTPFASWRNACGLRARMVSWRRSRLAILARNLAVLSILGPRGRLCDSPSPPRPAHRRVTSPVRARTPGPVAAGGPRRKVRRARSGNGFGGAKSVLLLYLQGSPSHIDTWDPKPDAPEGIRGEFKPIATSRPRRPPDANSCRGSPSRPTASR